MVVHTEDGLEFLGLRERTGHWQIVYGHLSGRRVILSLANDANQIDEIQDALKTAVSTKDMLVTLVAALNTHKIPFHIA
jgi:hypothetical protein